jgi:hypothetical protein
MPHLVRKRNEREAFFNIELQHLLSTIPTKMVLGGDFNCVLAKSDCMGQFNYSCALNVLVTGYALTDMWEASPEHGIYTHYSRQGTSRLDRIYVTKNLHDRKKGVETVVAAFTDHLSVVLHIALDVDIIRRGRGYWKMNAALMQDVLFQVQLSQQWKRWSQQHKYFPDIVTWWERSAKKHIRQLFIRKGTEKCKEIREMENFYYACLCDVLQNPENRMTQTEKVNRLKAQLIKLCREKAAAGMIEMQSLSSFQEERISLFHIIKQRNRRYPK